MLKAIEIISIILAVIIVAIVLFLGYAGFIPGIATLFGANKPRDLGIDCTLKHYHEFNQEAQTIVLPLDQDSEQSIKFAGQVELDEDFTEPQISGRLQYSQWKYLPMTHTQVKINDDGTIEVSGFLRKERLEGFGAAFGYTKEQVTKAQSYIKYALTNPPVYAKGTLSIKDNQVDLELQQLEVGRCSMLLNKSKAEQMLTNVLQTVITQVPDADIQNATFKNGKLQFEGTVPKKLSVIPAEDIDRGEEEDLEPLPEQNESSETTETTE